MDLFLLIMLNVCFCISIKPSHSVVFYWAVLACLSFGLFEEWLFDLVCSAIPQKSEIDASKTRGLQPTKVTGDIAFLNVGFTYPSRPDSKVLHKIDLKVPSGKTVAVVGASGCGKSTLVQLIQRFYDPDHGEVS